MIDICTVVFREELAILKAQAQSVALRCQDLGSLNFGSAMSACKGKSLFYECTSKAHTNYGAGLESALKQPQIFN